MNALPIAIARVAGLEFAEIDRLGLADRADFERIFEDEKLLRAELEREQTIVQELSAKPNFERSVLFSSRDLFQNLSKMRARPVADWAKKERQTALGVLEYLVRMGSKTSPLASFTTLQLIDYQRISSKSEADAPFDFFKNARWADAPSFENRLAEKSRSAANALFWAGLAERFLNQKGFARQLAVSLNPSVGGVEKSVYRFVHFDGEAEKIQSLAPSAAVDFVVGFLVEKGRIARFSALVAALAEATDAEKMDVETFVNQLIRSGLLAFELPVAGTEPTWPTQLYQKLAFFDRFEGQEAALGFLNFLNAAAKQLAWFTPEQLFEAQNEALERWKTAFADSDFEPRGEAVWFADAASDAAFDLKNEELEALVERLRSAARAEKATISIENQRLLAFFVQNWSETGEADFLDFAQKRLAVRPDDFEKLDSEKARLEAFSTSFEGRKMAVAFQPFRRSDGSLDAVVNQTWAGGGRGFGRFLTLFDARNAEAIRVWNRPKDGSEMVVGFHGQGWSSANCSPLLTDFELDFAGCRPRSAMEKRVGLRDFLVKIDSETGFLSLFHRKTGQRVRLVDLALESAEDRTEVLLLLFRVAAGPFSVPKPELARRRVWLLEAVDWPKKGRETEPIFSWGPRFLAFQKTNGLPRRAFFEIKSEGRAKPQLVDFQSVMSIQLFEKRLREAVGAVVLTEMLPEPSGFVFEKRAAELIVEFEI